MADDGLDALSSQQIHDLAVKRARRHLDARFFYDMIKLLPVAEAGAGEYEKSDDDILRLSAHFNDVSDSGKGEVGDLMRPFYLEYLRKHGVTAADVPEWPEGTVAVLSTAGPHAIPVSTATRAGEGRDPLRARPHARLARPAAGGARAAR